MEELACFIVARNLGDAVIFSTFFSKLVRRGYARAYLVWVHPQAAFLFEGVGDCEIVASPFPVSGGARGGWPGVLCFLKAALAVRARHPSVTIDLAGDVRERWFARMVGSRRHLHIGWGRGHPFNRLIRNPFGPGHPAYTVPPHELNVYRALDGMLDAIAPAQAEPATPAARQRPLRTFSDVRIGMHPFASQPCRQWPFERWRELAVHLARHGARLVAFGAPQDRARLAEIFGETTQTVALSTGSTAEFADEVAKLDWMIALDSFAIHMAERQGVRSVMINGANDHRIWTPPGALPLANSGGCPHYPCYNRPRCIGGPGEYACIHAITVEQVLATVLRETAAGI